MFLVAFSLCLSWISIVLCFFFLKQSYAKAGTEIMVFLLSLLSDRFIGVCHHAWLSVLFVLMMSTTQISMTLWHQALLQAPLT